MSVIHWKAGRNNSGILSVILRFPSIVSIYSSRHDLWGDSILPHWMGGFQELPCCNVCGCWFSKHQLKLKCTSPTKTPETANFHSKSKSEIYKISFLCFMIFEVNMNSGISILLFFLNCNYCFHQNCQRWSGDSYYKSFTLCNLVFSPRIDESLFVINTKFDLVHLYKFRMCSLYFLQWESLNTYDECSKSNLLKVNQLLFFNDTDAKKSYTKKKVQIL